MGKKEKKHKEKKVRSESQIKKDKARMKKVRAHIGKSKSTTTSSVVHTKSSQSRQKKKRSALTSSRRTLKGPGPLVNAVQAASDIAVMIALPASVNLRTRTDHSVVKTALAQPWDKQEIQIPPSPETLDVTSNFPDNMILIQLDRNVLNAIRIWTTLETPHAADESAANDPTATFVPLTTDPNWAYNCVFFQDGTNSPAEAIFLPTGDEWTLDLKFSHFRNADVASATTKPYGDKHYSMEYKSNRYIWVDSGKTAAGGTPSYTSVFSFALTANVPDNMELHIDIYRYGDGSDGLFCSGRISAGFNKANIPVFFNPDGTRDLQVDGTPEIHDWFRVQLEYVFAGTPEQTINIPGPLPEDITVAATPTTPIPNGTLFAWSVLGRCSTFDHFPIPDFIRNELISEEVKVLGASCLITNDQEEFFKNGRIFGLQADETVTYSSYLTGSGVITSQTQLTATMESDPDAVTFLANHGIYGFIKPSSNEDIGWQKPWKTTVEITNIQDSVHVDTTWKMDDQKDYLVFSILTVPRGGLGAPSPTLHLDFRFAIEYKTTNKWSQLGVTNTTPQQLDRALEELRLVPQFYPNAVHFPSILKALGITAKTAGILGTIAAPAAGPYAPGVLAASGTALGTGFALETLGEVLM